ncbi:conserved hypothetical protein [Mesotoga infera]|nr:conserved hypothetical protein [Mesotoga infera]
MEGAAMRYEGKYTVFDTSNVKVYSLLDRPSEVSISDLIDMKEIVNESDGFRSPELEELSGKVLEAKEEGLPVIVFSGAHVIKNGMGPLLSSLMHEKIITALGVNGAFTIHDFELAYCGRTSESIPNALSRGLFGFAEETNKYINNALIHGNKLFLGYGESMGRLLSGEAFPEKIDCMYREVSVQYNAYRDSIPLCVHSAMGTDIYHMTPYFDGESLGGCSARDFLIFANEISKLEKGGVCIVIGSAVIGAEVVLKAISMAANVGRAPKSITTASFDIRDADLDEASKNNKEVASYYFRDVKSIVTRIPNAFGGKGYYIKGNHKETLPSFYRLIMKGMP